MEILFFLLRVLGFIVLIPYKIYRGVKYCQALIFWRKKILTIDQSIWRAGANIVDEKTGDRCKVLFRWATIKRDPCPNWYRILVAIRPLKTIKNATDLRAEAGTPQP